MFESCGCTCAPPPIERGYQKRKEVIAANISDLLLRLRSSTYEEIAPKAEYWIEYAITEGWFTTPQDLAERVSSIAWEFSDPDSDCGRFLKEFRDAPHRSERAKPFVDEFCTHTLLWFAAASADRFTIGVSAGYYISPDSMVPGGGGGTRFANAGAFLGHLVKHGLLHRDLARKHLIKPLTTYPEANPRLRADFRIYAISRMFINAGDALLQGLLEPGDVQACFEILDAQPITYQNSNDGTRLQMAGIIEVAKLKEFHEVHAAWLQRGEEEEQGDPTTAEVAAGEANTPVAFVPQDLPTDQINAVNPSTQWPESLSTLRGMDFASDILTDVRASTISSPTLSISTISDLTPTELGEDNEESNGEQTPTRHEDFYFEDGNVEIMCGYTIFRIHSSIVSFSSPKLRDLLSKPILLNAPKSEGCPRIVFQDNAGDFAVLLKMIYTPGFPTWRKIPEFSVFASLLRMATKYGFSDVREQLFHSLEGAYPTKWETYQATKVLGEDIFGSPEPHPNAVLNLFLEQNVGFAIPVAAYRAALRGLSSLISDEPGTVLPRPILASIASGMEKMRGGAFLSAHSIVWNTGQGECRNSGCAIGGTRHPEQRREGLNKIYDAIIKKGGKGDILSPLSLGDVVCVGCAKAPEQTYRLWCVTIWDTLPGIFGLGKSWEAV